MQIIRDDCIYSRNSIIRYRLTGTLIIRIQFGLLRDLDLNTVHKRDTPAARATLSSKGEETLSCAQSQAEIYAKCYTKVS